MSQELRGAFHRELDKLDLALATLLGLVPDAVGQATTALLAGDADLSETVARWRGLVSELYSDVDGTIEGVMARQSPVARDLRFLMCCVRVVPEVRDAMELIGWLGIPRRDALSDRLTPRMRRLTLSLSDVTAETWGAVDRLWRERQADALVAVRQRHDAQAEVHSSLMAEVAAGGIDVDGAIHMALIISGYERLAGHAMAIGRLVTPLVVPAPA